MAICKIHDFEWKGKKSFGKNPWNIHSCAMLCVSFSSKSKAINVFSKHILKSKAHDSKELFEQHFVKDFDQNQKHMEAWNQRTSTPGDFTALC